MSFPIGTLLPVSHSLRGESVNQTIPGRLLKEVDRKGNHFLDGTTLNWC